MTRTEFMNELKHKLRRLPYEELHNAVCYYEEYFDEAGPQKEAEIIEKLGSPSNVASKIIGEYAIAAVEPQEKETQTQTQTENDNTKIKKRRSIVLITLLAVFASPIALPIAIAIFGVLIAIAAVFFSLVVAGGAMALAGIVTVGISIWTFTQGFGTGLYHLGMGLLVFGIGAAMALGMVQLSKTILQAFTRWMGRLLIRRGSNE